VPPSQIAVGSVFVYEMIIIIGVIAGCVAPFVFILFNKKIGKRSVL